MADHIDVENVVEISTSELDSYFDGESFSDDFETVLDMAQGEAKQEGYTYLILKIVHSDPEN